MPTSFKRLELLEQQIYHAHRAAVGGELDLRGLREVNPLILAMLKHVEQAGAESFSQRDLARMLDISPAAVTNSLKTMEQKGYILRTPEEGDARRNRMTLTDAGRGAVQGCEEAFFTVRKRMLEGFTPEEQELLAQFRERMLDNLRGAPGQKEEG